MENKQFLCKITKKLWKYYLLSPSVEHFEKILSYCSENFIMIGTGKHEFFVSLEQLANNMAGNLTAAEDIRFDVIDEWYECLELSADICLVYGGIWARQHAESQDDVLVDMDTRFSILYQRQETGWKIIHLHHSMPYFDQQSGEYYPRTLSEQVKDALALAREYRKKAELDLMTGIYNNESFRLHIQELLNNDPAPSGNLYVFDLDHFKSINDTYGHSAGDSLLKLFSSLLKKYFPKNSLIGRLGGDEFSVFEHSISGEDGCNRTILALEDEYCREGKKVSGGESIPAFSVGIARFDGSHRSYHALFGQADRALYQAKQSANNI